MYFGSDGGGIGGGIDVAGLLSNDWYFALGTFQSGPESKSAAKFAQDPLHDRGRAVLRAGKTISLPWFEVAATLRVRGKGGFVDGFTHEFRRALHDVFGMGTLAQRGNRGLKGIVGFSGHIWNDINLGSSADVKALLSPYAHGSLGTENAEAGFGVMLGFQPACTDKALAKMEPQAGTYAPFFGGDGFGVFAAARGVAYDSFYSSRAKHFIGEAGIVGQFTISSTVRGTALASCTTEPYSGALDPDCKATLRVGVLY